MMRHILLLCHRIPYPPDKGDRIRSYHLLRQLARNGAVDLGFTADEPVPESHFRRLHELCRRVACGRLPGARRWLQGSANLLLGRSITEGLFDSRPLHRKIDDWLRDTEYDAIVCFSSSMLPYVLGRGLDHRLIVDLVDVDSQKWFDYADRSRGLTSRLFRIEGRRVREMEQRAAQSRAVVLITEAEAREYRRFCPEGRVVVATNGVDLEYFAPQDRPPQAGCVFVGYLDYRANVLGLQWFCENVWPEARRRFPQETFQIVGRNPTPAVAALERIPGVEVVGPVDDVRPYVAGARAVVVPLPVARGVQNKLLEAMSMGRCVVASSAALEGLAAIPGKHMLRADSAEEWVQSLTAVWSNAALRDEIGRQARRYAEQCHDWSTCLAPLASLVEPAAIERTREKKSVA